MKVGATARPRQLNRYALIHSNEMVIVFSVDTSRLICASGITIHNPSVHSCDYHYED
jgi:hypothetical protein